MTPSRYCRSTSITSLSACPTSVFFASGVTRSSMPMEMPALRRVEEAERLQVVQHLHRHLVAEAEVAVVDERLKPLLLERAVDVGQPLRNLVVEDDAADGRVDDAAHVLLHGGAHHVLRVVLLRQVDEVADDAELDGRLRRDLLGVEREQHLVDGGEDAPLALRARLVLRQVVAAEDDVLRGHRDGLTRRGARGCCSRRASARPPRSAPRARAGCGRPSGRRRSRR